MYGKKYTHVKNIVISSVLCINCCSVPSRSHILNTLLYTPNPDFQPVLPRYLLEINKIKSFTVSTFLLIPSPSDYPLCLKKCLIFFCSVVLFVFKKIEDILFTKYCFYIFQTYLGVVWEQNKIIWTNKTCKISVSGTETLPLSISVNVCCYYLSDQLIAVKQGQTKLPINFCFWEGWPQQLTWRPEELSVWLSRLKSVNECCMLEVTIE